MPKISRVVGNDVGSFKRKTEVLEKAGLVSRDPAAYPGLETDLDADSGLDPSFRPIAYDTRKSTGEMVKCSVCAQHQKHFDGAIVRLMDGKTGLVGNDCGKRHFFGQDGWAALSNRWEKESEKALFDARFGLAKERCEEIDGLLRQWAQKLACVNEVRAAFQASAPRLFRSIKKDMNDGGLSIIIEVDVPFQRMDGSIEHRKELRPQLVCQINSEWFFEGRDIHAELVAHRKKLSRAIGLLSSESTSQNIVAVKRMIRDCRQGLEDCARMQARLSPLRSNATLSRMVRWANEVAGNGFTYTLKQPLRIQVEGPQSYSEVDLSNIPTDLDAEWALINLDWPRL